MSRKPKEVDRETLAVLLAESHKILCLRHADLSRLDRGGWLRPHEKTEFADITAFLGKHQSHFEPVIRQKPGMPGKGSKRDPKPPKKLTSYDVIFPDGEVRLWFCAAHGEPDSENLRRFVFAMPIDERQRGWYRIVHPKNLTSVCQIHAGDTKDIEPLPEGKKLVEGAYPPWKPMRVGRTG